MSYFSLLWTVSVNNLLFLGYRIQPTRGKWLHKQLSNSTLNIFSFEKQYSFLQVKKPFSICKCLLSGKLSVELRKNGKKKWGGHAFRMMFLPPLPRQLHLPQWCCNDYPILLLDKNRQNYILFACLFCFLDFVLRFSNILPLKTRQNGNFLLC